MQACGIPDLESATCKPDKFRREIVIFLAISAAKRGFFQLRYVVVSKTYPHLQSNNPLAVQVLFHQRLSDERLTKTAIGTRL